MNIKEDKIFLTGATGFVGSYIVRALLNEGYKNITCLTRSGSGNSLTEDFDTHVKWVQGDVLDLPLLSDILSGQDIVIHSAAMVTFNTKNKKKLLQTALDGTANVVNVSLEYSVKKLVHISSVAAIGRRKKQETITEKQIFSHTPYDTSYGLSKFLSEQEVWRAHAEGLPVTILNPALVLGAGNWNNSSPGIFAKVYNKMPVYPTGTNGVVDVRDVAQAVILALNPAVNGERFILSAENWSFKNLLDTIALHLNVKGPQYPLTPWLAGVAWRLEALMGWVKNQSPAITRETVKSMSVHSVYDNSKSKELLGLTYRDVHHTLKETSQSFLMSYPLGRYSAVFSPEYTD